MFGVACMLLSFGLCASIGFLHADRMRCRADGIEELVRCVRQCGLLLRYANVPLVELSNRVGLRERSMLFQAFSRKLMDGITVQEAWLQAFQTCCTQSPAYAALKSPEREAMDQFMFQLGATDAASELQRIALTAEELSALLEEARAQHGRKGRLYRTMGLLCGLAAAIMLW